MIVTQAIRSVLAALLVMPLCASAEDVKLAETYRFLVSSRSGAHGALGQIASGESKGRPYPFSFFSTADYWGAYVCAWPDRRCAVTDVYNPGDYSLTPAEGPGAALQVERVNTHNGSNIYDAATWQIAVMLGAVQHGFAAGVNVYELVSGQNALLRDTAKRALTNGSTFAYNGKPIKNPVRAYAFRMHSDGYIAPDPLAQSRYAELITARGIPPGRSEYAPGRITWTDWKPFTGENAWAFLLGPLHAAYLQHIVERQQKFVPWDDIALRNALDVLQTFAAMQSAMGGVYYSPSGTFANQGRTLVSPYFVSVENNASLYAGLQVLGGTLQAQLQHGALSSSQRVEARNALQLVRTMIEGGRFADGRTTAGLHAFFKQAAWREGEFVQGGYANDPERPHPWEPVLSPRAVDANTWTIAALGPQRIDAWFGDGAAYQAWERVKAWGGYGRNRELWGVGFSDIDGNGRDASGVYRDGVLSSEWTAGAITLVRRLLEYYSQANTTAARSHVRSLRADEASMSKGLQTLRYDRYAQTDFAGKPARYAELIPQRSLPYLYASRRMFVPFGWQANPLPSTCATAWAILLASRFDPFRYGGAGAPTFIPSGNRSSS